MNLADERIVWTDVESTGLNPWLHGSQLLQVAIIITDGYFTPLAKHESKRRATVEEVEDFKSLANDYVRSMHTTTGLWDSLTDPENIPFEEWDDHVHAWLSEQVEPGVARLAGNSPTLDRNHLELYMPKTYGHMHYRNLDMSSVEYFFELVEGRRPFAKKLTHEALADIEESVAQAKHHKAITVPF